MRTNDEIIKRLESVKTECGKHLSEGFAWICQPIDEAIKVLEANEWIPVSERLPNNHEYIKNNGLFNVSDGNRSYSEWFDIYGTQRFGEPTMHGFRADNCVTAWKPLPEPYKEVSE